MPRPLSSDQKAALTSGFIQPGFFVEIVFKSETVNMWTGKGTFTWNDISWVGLGGILGFSSTEDSSTVEAKPFTITLSALDATLMPECMTDYSLGNPVNIYLGMFTGGSTLIDTPFLTWAGRTDQPTVKLSGDTATIELACENRMIEMSNPSNRRYTIEDQQMDFPGDLGFMFVDGLQTTTDFWAGYPMVSTNS